MRLTKCAKKISVASIYYLLLKISTNISNNIIDGDIIAIAVSMSRLMAEESR